MSSSNVNYSVAQVNEAFNKALNPDATPTLNSNNLITSGGVNLALSALSAIAMTQEQDRTSDIRTSALAVSKPTIFEGSGSSYTGILPSNSYAYGIFLVFPRGGDRIVVACSAVGIAICQYNGSWAAWRTTTWS